MTDDIFQTDEAQRLEQERMDALAARVDAFGAALSGKRRSAIDGRATCGIEDEWQIAVDAYAGIDDANRAERMGMGKPSGPNGGYINGPVKTAAGRSTVLLNITRPYVDMATAKVFDILCPTADRNWGIRPTPVPELKDLESNPALKATPLGQAMMELEAEAKKAAEGAEKQIEDWLVECQWHNEFRKVIEDCVLFGTGVMKGPFPTKRRSRVVTQVNGQTALMMQSKICPASKRISPQDFFPDPACGEDIQEGSYCFERDRLTARALRELSDTPGYLKNQIDKVLAEGPGGKHKTDSFSPGAVRAKDDDQFEVWYFYGFADSEDLAAVDIDIDEGSAVPCIITMVNDTVIKAALQPLEEGEFPFDVVPWQRKEGVPWGTGVAIQVNTPQRMITAGTRAMMDNAGFSAGPQIAVRRDSIEPADGVWQITPRKVWFVKEGADVQAVNQAILAINVPTMQQELLGIIQFALKMAEDVTGMPMLMQGQQGQQGKAAETVGGMQMLNNNASVVLRRIARTVDDMLTTRHIRRYYRWIMEHHPDDSIKGDFTVDARGSTALIERDVQNQNIVQMAQIVLNPAFGISPKKWLQEFLKAQRLEPTRFEMDEQEQQALAQQQQGPQDNSVQVAQIRAEAQVQTAQIAAQASVEKVKADTDRDLTYVQAESERTRIEADAAMQKLILQRELEMLKMANEQRISLEAIKAQLAQTSMKLNVQRELSEIKGRAEQVSTPPTEPAGKAPAGQAYQR